MRSSTTPSCFRRKASHDTAIRNETGINEWYDEAVPIFRMVEKKYDEMNAITLGKYDEIFALRNIFKDSMMRSAKAKRIILLLKVFR